MPGLHESPSAEEFPHFADMEGNPIDPLADTESLDDMDLDFTVKVSPEQQAKDDEALLATRRATANAFKTDPNNSYDFTDKGDLRASRLN